VHTQGNASIRGRKASNDLFADFKYLKFKRISQQTEKIRTGGKIISGRIEDKKANGYFEPE
jgi:hypothetical protein